MCVCILAMKTQSTLTLFLMWVSLPRTWPLPFGVLTTTAVGSSGRHDFSFFIFHAKQSRTIVVPDYQARFNHCHDEPLQKNEIKTVRCAMNEWQPLIMQNRSLTPAKKKPLFGDNYTHKTRVLVWM